MPAMAFPRDSRVIRSPGDLAAVLAEAKRAISARKLKQIESPNPVFAPAVHVIDLAEQGPWPDYIELYFEDQAGKTYKLVAETYHGVGGGWEPV